MDIKKGESTLNIMLISIIIVIVVSIGIDSVKKNEINFIIKRRYKLKRRRKYTNRNSKVTGNFK